LARAELDFVFSTRVRYADIDLQGIMFNAAYLAYFDTAITEFFRARRFDNGAYSRATNVDFHVVKALVEYKKPVTYDAEIDILVRVARIGTSSLTFNLEIHPLGEDSVSTTGQIVYVHTDRTSRRAVPIGDDIKSILLGEASQQ
jgi:acyl-CoA thioester hydrolase